MSKIAINPNASGTGTVTLTSPNTNSNYTIVLPSNDLGVLTDAATITPDFGTNTNFTVTLGGNRTMENPSNMTVGQSGSIFIVQDGTGSRTLSWGSYWDFINGTAPTLTTTASAIDRIDYIVRTATSIHTVFTANYS